MINILFPRSNGHRYIDTPDRYHLLFESYEEYAAS